MSLIQPSYSLLRLCAGFSIELINQFPMPKSRELCENLSAGRTNYAAMLPSWQAASNMYWTGAVAEKMTKTDEKWRELWLTCGLWMNDGHRTPVWLINSVACRQSYNIYGVIAKNQPPSDPYLKLKPSMFPIKYYRMNYVHNNNTRTIPIPIYTFSPSLKLLVYSRIRDIPRGRF